MFIAWIKSIFNQYYWFYALINNYLVLFISEFLATKKRAKMSGQQEEKEKMGTSSKTGTTEEQGSSRRWDKFFFWEFYALSDGFLAHKWQFLIDHFCFENRILNIWWKAGHFQNFSFSFYFISFSSIHFQKNFKNKLGRPMAPTGASGEKLIFKISLKKLAIFRINYKFLLSLLSRLLQTEKTSHLLCTKFRLPGIQSSRIL